VTQGTGFSVSEVILGTGEILFTGVEEPDAVLVVSVDGARELTRSGVFDRVTKATLVLADLDVPLPELPYTVHRFPFRGDLQPRLAALGAVAEWLQMTGALPLDVLWEALDLRFGAQAAPTTAALRQFLNPALGRA
jgi:hypothetical protein